MVSKPLKVKQSGHCLISRNAAVLTSKEHVVMLNSGRVLEAFTGKCTTWWRSSSSGTRHMKMDLDEL